MWTLDIRADSNLKMLSQIEKTDEVIPKPGCNSQDKKSNAKLNYDHKEWPGYGL